MSEKKKRRTKVEMAKARLVKMRRDPFGRLSLEIGRYLETVGWRALVVGSPSIYGFEKPGLGHYEFTVQFSGGRLQQKANK